MKVCVIRETGTRIGTGQAIVRQLPWLFQIFWARFGGHLHTVPHGEQ
jgi:hypothetical protein